MLDTRGYRDSVRVIIIKDDKALITKTKFKGIELRAVPGGGIDKGSTMEEACIQECLEEVGILIQDPTSLGVKTKHEIESPNPERRKIYRGLVNYWFMARYLGIDETIRGSEGDSQSYIWVKIDTWKKIWAGGNSEEEFVGPGLDAMEAAEKLLKQKRKRDPLW